MAPRRPAAGGAADQGIQYSICISSLPPELLLEVFQHIPLAERLTTAALVCSQWEQLVHSPTLLASLEIDIGTEHLLPRLRSLLRWLPRRAAGHVRQLLLSVSGGGDADDLQEHEKGAAVVSALVLLAGSLQDVELVTRGLQLPPLGSWLVPLSKLTSLSLRCYSTGVSLVSPLSCLTALQQLRLGARAAELYVHSEAASFPPALTTLRLRGLCGPLPSRLGDLSRLEELTLSLPTAGAHEHAPLARLHSNLTALTLVEPGGLPECLSQLTGLRSLTIDDSDAQLGEPDAAVLAKALGQMQQLTQVCVIVPWLPCSLSALSSLRHIDTVCWQDTASGAQPLPGGSRLGQLRRLAVAGYYLWDAASLATLSGALQLERLGVTHTHTGYSEMEGQLSVWVQARRSSRDEYEDVAFDDEEDWEAQGSSVQAPGVGPVFNTALRGLSAISERLTDFALQYAPADASPGVVRVAVNAGLVLLALSFVKSLLSFFLTIGTIFLGAYVAVKVFGVDVAGITGSGSYGGGGGGSSGRGSGASRPSGKQRPRSKARRR
ncbi:F-box LRR-repeat 21 isoform A [Chlorella sorokiniana]|uniref:F-box LRR-repeat 21 isoform A n=1 Tax=Chlorella sorokiniana TaxID=3076 RepID=A0A2P6TH03_CHLSO|nr:F-box LRR-repeat 21 isoform A [Chlorella sorokiniana]|eukprot:PRW33572.1 F-box LRR-repeat 21 isoform A [Chlorella sorokiniana]